MASRILVVVLLLAACSRPPAAQPGGPTTAAAPSTTTSTTIAPSTTTTPPTTAPPTTSTTIGVSRPGSHLVATVEVWQGLEADVHAPPGAGSHPVAVLLHGGGWFGGDRRHMAELADYLAERGVVAVNAGYRTLSLGGGFPATFDDVACALRAAAAVTGDYTDTPSPVAIVGYSAGAHLGATVAMAGDVFGGDCPWPGPVEVDRFVGLAGPYDVSRLGFLLAPFFGGDLEEVPEAWTAGNPLTYINPEVEVLLIHGEDDPTVPVEFTTQLAEALQADGGEAVVLLLPGVDHGDIRRADVVGEAVAEFLTAG